MKKILLAAIAACLIGLPAQARKVRGSVSAEGKPMAGVTVSDGYRFTSTGADGSFSLNTHKDARFVFVITPSGFVADFSSGAPELVYEGKTIEAIKDGAFAESDARSAPYFNVRIDGITELS